jgi:hypothetical protein
MKTTLYYMGLVALVCLDGAEAAMAQHSRPTTRTKAAYHGTITARTKARAGAYARYSRSNRHNEENLKLAPGFRLNMPSPPTTDYMGRPLKKKPAKPRATTISAEGGAAPTRRP